LWASPVEPGVLTGKDIICPVQEENLVVLDVVGIAHVVYEPSDPEILMLVQRLLPVGVGFAEFFGGVAAGKLAKYFCTARVRFEIAWQESANVFLAKYVWTSELTPKIKNGAIHGTVHADFRAEMSPEFPQCERSLPWWETG
jgi:hypothetical protein